MTFSCKFNLKRHCKIFHGPNVVISCKKCHFQTFHRSNLLRHHGLKHLRNRSSYVPRRSISTSQKKKAMAYFKSSSTSTPEKKAYIEKNFHLTPNTQSRLFRRQNQFMAAKKSLFRVKGGGRKIDEFWKKIEERLLVKFKAQRDAKAIVHRRHLLGFVYQICAKLEINLASLAESRNWKDVENNLRKRIRRFCIRHKIKMKKCSRQLHKDSQV